MKLVILILMPMLFFTDLSAQKATPQKGAVESSRAVVSGRKEVGRYEILVFKTTAIRLDTFTGETYYCDYGIYRVDSRKNWNLIRMGKGFPDDSSNTKSKYRVYGQATYKEGIENFYLLNTETGQTWISDVSSHYWELLVVEK
jgi:hypothetical protein